MPLSLRDCSRVVRGENTVLTLPLVINLRGLRPERAFWNDHDRFRNRFGDLAVCCDVIARFFPSREYGSGLSRLSSLYAWPDERGRRFQYENKYANVAENFVQWVNEFGRMYGEQHLYIPKH